MSNKQTKYNLTLGTSGTIYRFNSDGNIYIDILMCDPYSFISFENIEDGTTICGSGVAEPNAEIRCNSTVKATTDYKVFHNLTNTENVTFEYVGEE